MIDGRPPMGLKGNSEYFNVLIVDDSVFVSKQLTQIFSSESFNVISVAKDGVEALEKYKELSPNIDLVTMDITMPRMDGITCLEQIMEFDPKAKVIMVSALGKQDLVKKALVIGAKNYIVKPLDRKKVLERVASILGITVSL